MENVADRGVCGCPTPFQRKGGIQPAAMDGDEGDDAAMRVAAGHNGEDGERQHGGQLVKLPLCPAWIRDVRQHIEWSSPEW